MELIYKDLISDELKELEISLLESISSDVNLATEISNYLLVSGGKRIRPSICILLAKVFNYEGNDLIKLAASIELLHTATLIHDDVVDESLIREEKKASIRNGIMLMECLLATLSIQKPFNLWQVLRIKKLLEN